MVEIYLAPKSSKQEIQKIDRFLRSAPVATTVVILLVVFLILLLNKRSLREEIKQDQIIFAQNENIIKNELGMDSYELANKASNLTQILSGRLYWSNILGKFDNLLNPEIKVKNTVFSADEFKINVSASALNYEMVEKQINDLKNNTNFVRSVTLNEPSFAENSISFSLEIVLNKNLLKSVYSL